MDTINTKGLVSVDLSLDPALHMHCFAIRFQWYPSFVLHSLLVVLLLYFIIVPHLQTISKSWLTKPLLSPWMWCLTSFVLSAASSKTTCTVVPQLLPWSNQDWQISSKTWNDLTQSRYTHTLQRPLVQGGQLASSTVQQHRWTAASKKMPRATAPAWGRGIDIAMAGTACTWFWEGICSSFRMYGGGRGSCMSEPGCGSLHAMHFLAKASWDLKE